MFAGLDVGGTHTDAVLVDHETGRPCRWVKVPTRAGDVTGSVVCALERLLAGEDARAVRRLCVSTTLGLNALLTNRTDRVGTLALPGPGIDPALFWGPDPLFHRVDACQDHRGRVVRRPAPDEVRGTLHRMRASGAAAVAVVSKFSPKNPSLEETLATLAADVFPPGTPVVQGARLGGGLNFPRRLHSAWCAAALTRITRNFTEELEQALRRSGLECPVVLLKADAGTCTLSEAADAPLCLANSGPAASLLGVWALFPGQQDLLMVDMGGTTTDLALLAGGLPLLAPGGVTLADRPTLERGLWTHSLALGGDSCLHWGTDELRIGPDRAGPALAFAPEDAALRPPTLTDALFLLTERPLPAGALSALERFARSNGHDAPSAARLAVDTALERIRREADLLLEQVNSRPAYTIRDLLREEPLRPCAAVCIGGPAALLAEAAGTALGMPVLLPEYSACANALGAALARPTCAATLYADTRTGLAAIPELGFSREIPGSYTVDDARRELLGRLVCDAPSRMAEAPQITGAESFHMLDDAGRRGRVIRVRGQLPPGLLQPQEHRS